MNQVVILFHSAHHSIWANKLVKKAGIEQKLMPVPRRFSSDCGYCLRVREEDCAKVLNIFDENQVEYDRVEQLDQ